MLHYLRIAVTALSLTACVLLIALWVRSYWWFTHFGNEYYISCVVADGVFQSNWYRNPSENAWYIDNTRMEDFNRMAYGGPTRPVDSAPALLPNFAFGPFWLVIPVWFLVIVAVAIAVSPWVSRLRRFSLRTLLIATTLVAVGMGIVVALS
jgi:hypothetical protein